MNNLIVCVRSGMLIAIAHISLSACSASVAEASSTPRDLTVTPKVEVLSDGNLRDPIPTVDALKEFFVVTKKNMVLLPGGTFQMGDWGAEVTPEGLPFDGSRDSKPLHQVKLRGFAIGKFPVTYAEFDMFTAANRLPRISQDSHSKRLRLPDRPAGVTWDGANAYCTWLAKETGLSYNLPTEAQWEYAARSGGKRKLYPTDNGELEPGRNIPSHAQLDEAGGLVAVSAFPPNPAGLYYMGTRISEFTNDWYSDSYYENSPPNDPTGPNKGESHVVRGFTGSNDSAMTIKRWKKKETSREGSWTLYGEKAGQPSRQIPFTKFSNYAGNGFRCALNHLTD